MSSTPPCTVIIHVAGDVSPPTSPTLSSSNLPSLSPKTPARNFLRPPGPRPFYGRRRPSLNDYYPHFRPSWKVADGSDPGSGKLTLVPIDSLDLDPDFAPDQPWHKRWKAKSKAQRKTRGKFSGRVLFCGAVVAIVVLRGLVFLVELACLPLALQSSSQIV
ncbi:hypothetical protein GSI_08058 [Ganoderma sinense ZZ0214-1]|uniref:Uncharacterized protein n=1 Tax=Ganoderma sinense ZZ0214-1 TaxID=1077348 RepID=A0A2G8S7W6_9APHY|nr:hypothetical protein GSI_08058 [Ganoderma sinense ZZ0214-1]